MVYKQPKIVFKEGKSVILYKRLETFFEEDRKINHNENIMKGYDYGYTNSEIGRFLGLTRVGIAKVIKKLTV